MTWQPSYVLRPGEHWAVGGAVGRASAALDLLETWRFRYNKQSFCLWRGIPIMIARGRDGVQVVLVRAGNSKVSRWSGDRFGTVAGTMSVGDQCAAKHLSARWKTGATLRRMVLLSSSPRRPHEGMVVDLVH